MDEVESKLSSLSISANQQLEGKQQEAETGDTKPCTEKRDCAKSHLPLEEGREVIYTPRSSIMYTFII